METVEFKYECFRFEILLTCVKSLKNEGVIELSCIP
jgi:hypothetical protein